MSEAGTQTRLENERAFHNARFAERAEDPRGHLDKFYDAVGDAFAAHAAILRERGRGADVLEYGCADGSLALEELRVPGFAKSFHGIDISDAAIDRARERAAALGFANARFDRMNAEAMDFPDACFDVVYGRGIIHHLRLDAAFPEIARVLRPGGLALFAEPLGHNPVLNWYRNRTPDLRTADEHPLVRDDFALARRHFTKVEASFHGLTTLAAVPLRRSAIGPFAFGAFRGLDRLLLSLPGLRWQAWYALLRLER
jgi:SAM-dependent methyltransferase